MAAIAIDSEYPDRAAKAAMQGVAKISVSHPLAIRLRAHAACAYARLGQRESCETLFGEAYQLYERLPARAQCHLVSVGEVVGSRGEIVESARRVAR
jgi:hypothetical protein